MVSKKNKNQTRHSKTSKAKKSLLGLPKKMKFYNIEFKTFIRNRKRLYRAERYITVLQELKGVDICLEEKSSNPNSGSPTPPEDLLASLCAIKNSSSDLINNCEEASSKEPDVREVQDADQENHIGGPTSVEKHQGNFLVRSKIL